MKKLLAKIKSQKEKQPKRTYAVIATLVLILGGFIYWLYSQRYISTDDAYLNANVVQIAPRVTGQVAHLYVDNNQYVHKGQALIDLDAAPFQVAIDKADAQLAINQASLQNAASTAQRMLALVQRRVMSMQAGDDAVAKLKSTAAEVKLAQANLEQAKLNLQYTHVVAPTSGWVSNLSIREGDNLVADQSLFAIISDEEFWVDANFKETELGSIEPKQTASINVDMYPGHVFTGVVESISGGSGTVFSLMPPQNATGNWVKVTQRVPVRVRVLPDDFKKPLRIGTSASVTIDLHSS